MKLSQSQSSRNALRGAPVGRRGRQSRCQATASPAAVTTEKIGAHTVQGTARKRNEDAWDTEVRFHMEHPDAGLQIRAPSTPDAP